MSDFSLIDEDMLESYFRMRLINMASSQKLFRYVDSQRQNILFLSTTILSLSFVLFIYYILFHFIRFDLIN